jgi:threonine dehydrogenase-like Zn-dependent dehydrogenase
MAPTRSWSASARSIRPGKVFDRTVSLEEVPEGSRVMADRKALKVLIGP